MTESENFLRRWSRRKRAAADAAQDVVDHGENAPAEPELTDKSRAPAADGPVDGEFHDGAPTKDTARISAMSGGGAEDAQDFDLSQLPSIESITATTDMRPFLARGVPESLRRAALRRAWSADPAIRDFIGLAENQWDFTADGGVPGFGPLLQSDDVQQLVARVFGATEPGEALLPREAADVHSTVRNVGEETTTLGAQASAEQEKPRGGYSDESAAAPPPTRVGAVGDNNAGGTPFFASQNESESSERVAMDRLPRRGHGSALPT